MTAGIFKQTDYKVATTKLRASRASSRPELLVTWPDDIDLGRLKFLESTDFPCQRGVPDRRASAKRLLTFLYYHIIQEREREDG